MKNIHLLPTDKSSIISIKDSVLILHRLQWRKGTQHIYITSDEEIKEGEYQLYNPLGNFDNAKVSKAERLLQNDGRRKKIILTTDQDLIKDGVQAIDDEFLEWFVKNPSCEEIEVEKLPYDGTKSITKYWGGEYKITIPKEEPKNICIQTGLPCGMQCLSEEACNSIRLKQETSEEAKCVNGCKHYYGGEIRHHKHCFYYAESFSKMFYDLERQQEQILDFLYSEITERRDYSASKMCEKVIEFIKNISNEKKDN